LSSKRGELSLAESPLYLTDKSKAMNLAKERYLSNSYVRLVDITNDYGIPYVSFMYWLKGSGKVVGWRALKKEIEFEAKVALINLHAKSLGEVADASLTILQKQITRVLQEEANLSVSDIQKMTQCLERLVTMMRLEEGKPTEITAHMDIKATGMRAIVHELQEVDFVDYELTDEEDILQ